MTKPSFLSVTDLFCGAGGSSLGMHHASDDVEITLALNHWQLAIESHNANFPNTAHDCVDVSATDPRRYRSTDVLWASPECTNHSLAKGQKRKHQAQLELFGAILDDPASARSRATMFDVPRFAEYHDYRVIIVENVVDVRHWRLYGAWLSAMDALGYDHKEVYFNSMFAHLHPAAVRTMHDFAPQSRDRIYIVFWKRGHPAPDLEFRPLGRCDRCERDVETVQAWKNGRRWGRYRQQYVYRCPACAREVVPYHFAAWNAIDWSRPAERIGDRKKPLKERTMERIRRGLVKYGNTWLAVDLAYGDSLTARPMLAALPTQTATDSFGLVMPTPFLAVNYSPGYSKSVTEPTGAITASDHHSLVIPAPFLTSYYGTGGGAAVAEEPMDTLTGIDKHALVMPFYVGYANGDGPPHAVTEPLLTLHTENNAGLVFPTEPPAIEDCGFRMLAPEEVGRGMAFPDEYIVRGNGRERVKQYGNAVVPVVARMLMRRVLATFS